MSETTISADTIQNVVATYSSHNNAEEAVRLLEKSGLPMKQISIIGRDWQVREDVLGFFHPGDAMKIGAAEGAWVGGIFGLFMGFGMFVFPVAGVLFVLGPLAGLITGAIGGAGVGALVSGLVNAGIPKDSALKYQKRLEAGEFLVMVHGSPSEIERAHTILQDTSHTSLTAHKPAV